MRWVLVYVLVSVLLLVVASVFGLLGVGEQVATLVLGGVISYGLWRWSHQSSDR